MRKPAGLVLADTLRPDGLVPEAPTVADQAEADTTFDLIDFELDEHVLAAEHRKHAR